MKRFVPSQVVLASLLLVFSCTDFIEEELPVAFSTDATEWSFSKDAGTRTMVLRSSARWELLQNPEWMNLESVASSKSSPFEWILTFSIETNDNYNREGQIRFQSQNEYINVPVLQEGRRGVYVPVESVLLSSTTLTMTEGDSQSLTAIITPTLASDKTVTWTSSNPSVVSVSYLGVLTAQSVGTATITVKTNDLGKTATCNVTVKAKVVPVTGVVLDNNTISLTEGESLALTAIVTPSNATDQSVTWSSSNTSVATVSSLGVVTAKAVGSATITVKTNDGSKTASCSVSVKAKIISVTGVSLDRSTLSMTDGDTYALTASVTPSNATDQSVTWSSSNTSVATVSSLGVVTAKAVGSATITVKTNDGSKTASCSVSVKAKIISVTGVSLDRSTLSMTDGDTYALTASVTPSNATDQSVTWSSNNTSVAIVSSSGVVTAKSVGSATITVKTNDGSKTAACVVTVTPVSVTAVTLDKTSMTLTIGGTERLTATVLPSNATNKNVTWSSTDTSVAVVDSNGNVSAIKVGNAVITATTEDGGKTATCILTVDPVSVTGVNLNKSSLTLLVGGSETLTATVAPSNATNKRVSWSSSNTSVVTVDSNGKVNAVSGGTATITATTEDGGKTASCSVTVNVPVTGVGLNKSSLSIVVGNTELLVATIVPSDATNQSVSWTSSNTSVATVSSSGLVTARAIGDATITVTTADGSKTSTCAVTVLPIAVTGVSLNKYSLSMYESDTETLIATVSPTNASNKSVTWSSSNTSVAAVSSYGQVTAIGAGSATVTVTTIDGGITASCAITVQSDPYGAVDLGLSVKWASFNYGASSITAPGGYYFYGDPTGSAVIHSFSPPNINSIGGTQYDIVRRNWGGNWRIPTRSEINELYSLCNWTRTTLNGVSVLKVTGPSGASIYLPFTGCAFPDDGPIGTTQIYDGDNAYLMSDSSYSDSNGRFVYIYYFTPSGQRNSVSYRADFIKFPIRPVR